MPDFEDLLVIGEFIRSCKAYEDFIVHFRLAVWAPWLYGRLGRIRGHLVHVGTGWNQRRVTSEQVIPTYERHISCALRVNDLQGSPATAARMSTRSSFPFPKPPWQRPSRRRPPWKVKTFAQGEKRVGQIRELLLFVVQLYQRHNVSFNAFTGTALGLHRDGDIIPWDDDADLMVMDYTADRVDWHTLAQEAAREGHRLHLDISHNEYEGDLNKRTFIDPEKRKPRIYKWIYHGQKYAWWGHWDPNTNQFSCTAHNALQCHGPHSPPHLDTFVFQMSGKTDSSGNPVVMMRGFGWLGSFSAKGMRKRPLLPAKMFNRSTCHGSKEYMGLRVPMPCPIESYLDMQYSYGPSWRTPTRDSNRQASHGDCNVWVLGWLPLVPLDAT